jgi:uncharacterized membrane protein
MIYSFNRISIICLKIFTIIRYNINILILFTSNILKYYYKEYSNGWLRSYLFKAFTSNVSLLGKFESSIVAFTIAPTVALVTYPLF